MLIFPLWDKQRSKFNRRWINFIDYFLRTSPAANHSTRSLQKRFESWNWKFCRVVTHSHLSSWQISRSWWAAWCTCATASRTLRTAACWRQISGLRSATSSPGTPALCWAFQWSPHSALGKKSWCTRHSNSSVPRRLFKMQSWVVSAKINHQLKYADT